MPLSAFTDRAKPPSPEAVHAALGPASAAWDRMRALVVARVGPVEDVWAFGGAKIGWGMRLVRAGRVLVYMTPQEGQFLVSIVLGERAVAAAKTARLPAAVLAAIEAAPRYSEGRGVRWTIGRSGPLVGLARLVEIKAAH